MRKICMPTLGRVPGIWHLSESCPKPNKVQRWLIRDNFSRIEVNQQARPYFIGWVLMTVCNPTLFSLLGSRAGKKTPPVYRGQVESPVPGMQLSSFKRFEL